MSESIICLQNSFFRHTAKFDEDAPAYQALHILYRLIRFTVLCNNIYRGWRYHLGHCQNTLFDQLCRNKFSTTCLSFVETDFMKICCEYYCYLLSLCISAYNRETGSESDDNFSRLFVIVEFLHVTRYNNRWMRNILFEVFIGLF